MALRTKFLRFGRRRFVSAKSSYRFRCGQRRDDFCGETDFAAAALFFLPTRAMKAPRSFFVCVVFKMYSSGARSNNNNQRV